jgi:hypothetical protein
MIVPVLSVLAEPSRPEVTCLLAGGYEHSFRELMRKPVATRSMLLRPMQILERRDPHWGRYQIKPDLSPPVVRLVAAVLERDLAIGKAAA